MNKVIMIGNLSKDPEVRTTNSGTTVCSFTIAVNRPRKQGEEEKADFFTVKTFGKTAESCNRYLAKGKKVGIAGGIYTRSWQDDNGAVRYATEIVADNVEFLSPVQPMPAPAPQNDYASGLQPVDQGDLPF